MPTKASEVRWVFVPHSSTESPRSLTTFARQSGWTRSGVYVQSEQINNTSISVLTVANIRLEHFGLYTCEANDGEGTTVEYMVSGEEHL